MFVRQRRKKTGRHTAVFAIAAVAASVVAFQGGWTSSAQADEYNKFRDAPAGRASLPLADDIILNYADGKPVASAYKFSYICPTNPDEDVNPPYNLGNGVDETRDFTEYQSQPCFFGTGKQSEILETGEIQAAFGGVRELYGLAPWFNEVPTVAGQLNNLYAANTPLSDIQANCPRQGLPVTNITDPTGTCLMHMNVLHFPAENGGGDLRYHVPPQVPLPAHSHILGGVVSPDGKVSTKESPTALGPTWWHPRSVLVLDRSIWPDAAGNCPAGKEKCLTSIKALREAQKNGQARTEGGSNILLYFSVQEIDQAGLNTLDTVALHDAKGVPNVANIEKQKAWNKQVMEAQAKKNLADIQAELKQQAKKAAAAEKKAAQNAPVRNDAPSKQTVAAREAAVARN